MAGLAVKIFGARAVKVPQAAPAKEEFCPCDFTCNFRELVFADPSGTEPHKRDFTDFLTRKISASDTVEIQLWKAGAQVAVLNDDTYGTFYNGFAAQPNYVGFLLNWSKVFTAFSGGTYQVKIATTILGQSSTFVSRLFSLNMFDERLANDTIKLESYQTGNIIASEFDYTDLLDGGWYSSIRLPGVFRQVAPQVEVDDYINTAYQNVQNRTKVFKEYEAQFRSVPESIQDVIISKDIIGNSILITDYRLFADQIFRRLPVKLEGIGELNNLSNGKVNFSVTFRDRTEDIIKENFS